MERLPLAVAVLRLPIKGLVAFDRKHLKPRALGGGGVEQNGDHGQEKKKEEGTQGHSFNMRTKRNSDGAKGTPNYSHQPNFCKNLVGARSPRVTCRESASPPPPPLTPLARARSLSLGWHCTRYTRYVYIAESCFLLPPSSSFTAIALKYPSSPAPSIPPRARMRSMRSMRSMRTQHLACVHARYESLCMYHTCRIM